MNLNEKLLALLQEALSGGHPPLSEEAAEFAYLLSDVGQKAAKEEFPAIWAHILGCPNCKIVFWRVPEYIEQVDQELAEATGEE